MTSFTTKTTIPFGNTSDRPRVYTTSLNDYIWMLFDNGIDRVYPKIQLYKFKTGELKFETVDCVFPESFIRNAAKLLSCQNHIYAIFYDGLVYKLDVNTLQWEHLMNLGYIAFEEYGPIIGDEMYGVEYSTTSLTPVVKVNLTTKAVSRVPLHRSHGDVNIRLMENNGEIYMLENLLESRTFIVSKIANGRQEVLIRHHYDNIEGAELFSGNFHTHVTNGRVLEGCLNGVEPLESIYLELFDFATNTFKRTAIPDFFRDENTEYLSDLIVMGNQMFAVFMEPKKKETEFSIRMIELSPKLSTICMLSLVEKTYNASDFDAIKDNLSDFSRLKLNSMLEWRIPENKRWLEKRQKLEAVLETMQMEDDGVLDHNMQRILEAEFDSDFSDQSDSDIDGEDEPLEETDEENDINDERTTKWMIVDLHVVRPDVFGLLGVGLDFLVAGNNDGNADDQDLMEDAID